MGETSASSAHDAFFFYNRNNLEAVRCGKWKLHVRKRDQEMTEVYDLEADIGETNDVAAQHPDVVAELQARLQACREDIGDEATGVTGANVRPIGKVDNPQPLTQFDPNCPYMWAEYDTDEMG
jgi:arylsulfatase A